MGYWDVWYVLLGRLVRIIRTFGTWITFIGTFGTWITSTCDPLTIPTSQVFTKKHQKPCNNAIYYPY